MPDLNKLIQEFDSKMSPLELLIFNELSQHGVSMYVKRDDLIDAHLSGNKWRKLNYNLREAIRLEKPAILTFGGAYSNHIYAVAAAGRQFGLKTIGIIRGEAPKEYGSTLRFASKCGMKLHFLSRSAYREKTIPQDIDLSSCYILPEGGTNCLGLKGCKRIVTEVQQQIPTHTKIDYWCTSSGTGGTASGIISALNNDSNALVFSALKGDFLKTDIQKLLETCEAKTYNNWQLITDYHFGGYAKFKPELIEFINQFKSTTGIPLDPIYTGKMFYGIFDLLKKGFFEKGSTIVAVHTGGLQGVAGFNERFGGVH